MVMRAVAYTKNNDDENHPYNTTISSNIINSKGEAGDSGQSIRKPGCVTAQ